MTLTMKKTIDDIRAMTKLTITPQEAADVLGLDPQSIRKQAEVDPSMLGFNVCRVGCSTVIPRKPFLRWLTGE